eukprot:6191329-Pleurochrysis_carterae.AAC.6
MQASSHVSDNADGTSNAGAGSTLRAPSKPAGSLPHESSHGLCAVAASDGPGDDSFTSTSFDDTKLEARTIAACLPPIIPHAQTLSNAFARAQNRLLVRRSPAFTPHPKTAVYLACASLEAKSARASAAKARVFLFLMSAGVRCLSCANSQAILSATVASSTPRGQIDSARSAPEPPACFASVPFAWALKKRHKFVACLFSLCSGRAVCLTRPCPPLPTIRLQGVLPSCIGCASAVSKLWPFFARVPIGRVPCVRREPRRPWAIVGFVWPCEEQSALSGALVIGMPISCHPRMLCGLPEKSCISNGRFRRHIFPSIAF